MSKGEVLTGCGFPPRPPCAERTTPATTITRQRTRDETIFVRIPSSCFRHCLRRRSVYPRDMRRGNAPFSRMGTPIALGHQAMRTNTGSLAVWLRLTAVLVVLCGLALAAWIWPLRTAINFEEFAAWLAAHRHAW